MNRLRTAVIGAGHWHSKFIYRALLADSDVVAISEPDEVLGERAATALGGIKRYPDHLSLLEAERVDFAFVYGRHVEMADYANTLIDAGIPFAIEKPAGLNAADVRALANAAQAAELFVAVPFTHRMTPWVRTIKAIGSPPAHATFRLLSGPPSRYLENRVPWVLNPVEAGGGCTINLSVLFVDLFRHLCDEDVELASAVMSSVAHGLAVEDYSQLTLLSSAGVATIETGYTFPNSDSDVSCSVRLRSGEYFLVRDDSFTSVFGEKVTVEPSQTHHRHYYGEFASQTLTAFLTGREPIANLDDLVRAMDVIDASYSTASHRVV